MENMLRFTFRTTEENLSKLNHIAKYNGRSSNKELEQLVLRHIENFEKKNGKIKLQS